MKGLTHRAAGRAAMAVLALAVALSGAPFFGARAAFAQDPSAEKAQEKAADAQQKADDAAQKADEKADKAQEKADDAQQKADEVKAKGDEKAAEAQEKADKKTNKAVKKTAKALKKADSKGGAMAGTMPVKPEVEPQHVQVQHILIGFQGSIPGKGITRSKDEAKKLAYEILDRARKGEDFDALVRQYTEDSPPGIYGMSGKGVAPAPGEYPRDQMVPAFGNVGFAISPGNIGIADYDAQTSPYGYHIIKRLK